MGYQLIARAVSAVLFALGLGCLAQAGIFSTSHATGSGAGVANIWTTTSSMSSFAAAANYTFVSKFIGGLNTPPGANTRIQFTLTAAGVTAGVKNMWIGGGQTLASQCSGTLRVWNFAAAPTQVLSSVTSIPGNSSFTTSPVTFTWPGAPFIVAFDLNNGQNLPFATPNSTNTNPSSGTGNFVTYFLNGTQQAGTQCKNASYSTITDQIRLVTQITSIP